MGIIYWNQKHQKACEAWLSADTRQQFHIYNTLIGGMRELVENIMRRYFSIPESRRVETREDVINHIFMHLHLYKPERQKAYTFCGTVARNKIYEFAVRIPNTVKVAHLQLLDGDFEYIMEEAQPIQYHTTYIDIDYDEVIKKLKSKKTEIQNQINAIVNRDRRKSWFIPECTKQKHLVKVLELMIEFIEKYENLEATNIVDYIHINYINQQTKKPYDKKYIAYLFRELFSVSVGVRDESLTEEKHRENWMFEDSTPLESEFLARSRRKYTAKRLKSV